MAPTTNHRSLHLFNVRALFLSFAPALLMLPTVLFFFFLYNERVSIRWKEKLEMGKDGVTLLGE